MIKKYNYFYKITNLINGHFYYGIHSTNDLNDGYMGSGHRLHRAFKKYGHNNFIKEIIKYFENREDALNYEETIVNEILVKDKNCYNEVLGGGGIITVGLFPVYHKDTGEKIMISKDDPRYLSGEYRTLSYGLVPAIDKYNNHFLVKNNDKRFLSGELKKQFEGKVCVKDKDNNIFYVNNNDPRYLSGELTFHLKNQILVKDGDGNNLMIYKDDPRYLNGELIAYHKGRKHSDDHKKKLSEARRKNSHIKEKQSGYDTKWMYNENLGINKRIKKDKLEEYLKNGWKLGKKYSKN